MCIDVVVVAMAASYLAYDYMTSLMSFLSPSVLRSFLISGNESGRNSCVRLARLVAAYYLDLPLFEPAVDTEFPSLFIWTQMSKTGEIHCYIYIQLPRPPVYSQPDITTSKDKEYTNHLRMHIYLQILLTSLQKSNRLENELTSTLLHLPTGYNISSSQSHSRSVLTRALLLILRVIYRDAFSLAVVRQSNELSNVAAKYKALINDDVDEKPFQKWCSLATEQDMSHVTMFIEYLKENYISQWNSKLPALSLFTREVWYNSMLNSIENESMRRENDWLSGIIYHQNKPPYFSWRLSP
uniref:Ras-GEF domain-containing protein n=1 Tax=Heterorhabditis bacteriophora TaxID=37862 RepID=A0A1I7X7J4_HETBA